MNELKAPAPGIHGLAAAVGPSRPATMATGELSYWNRSYATVTGVHSFRIVDGFSQGVTLLTHIDQLRYLPTADQPARSTIRVPHEYGRHRRQGRRIVGFKVSAPSRDIYQVPRPEGSQKKGVILDHVDDPSLALTFSLFKVGPFPDSFAPAEDSGDVFDQVKVVTEGAEFFVDIEGLGEHIELHSILSLVAEPFYQVTGYFFPTSIIPEQISFINKNGRAGRKGILTNLGRIEIEDTRDINVSIDGPTALDILVDQLDHPGSLSGTLFTDYHSKLEGIEKLLGKQVKYQEQHTYPESNFPNYHVTTSGSDKIPGKRSQK